MGLGGEAKKEFGKQIVNRLIETRRNMDSVLQTL